MSKGGGAALIARELALDIAQGAYTPGDAVHVPGVANVLCDALSRLYAPSEHRKSMPEMCAALPRTAAADRGVGFWRTLPAHSNVGAKGERSGL